MATLTFDTHSIDGTTVIYEGRRPVITVHGNPEDPEAAKALARKVAAVEDLYAAAKRALRVLVAAGEGVRPTNVLGALDTAIRKAEGRDALALSRGGEDG